MTECNDVISAICYGCESSELDKFYKIAIVAIKQFDNADIQKCIRHIPSSENVTDIMKRVIFIVVLNKDEWVKSIVCGEESEFRGDRQPLEVAKQRPFFYALVGICEDYMNIKTDETEMIERVKLAYEGKDHALKQSASSKKTKKKRRRKQKVVDDDPVAIEI